jgi:hypothetical protein
MWTPRTKRTGLLAAVIERAREEQLDRILQAQVQGRRPALAQHLKEFDALVVEYVAVHHIHAIHEPQGMAEFVWMEP